MVGVWLGGLITGIVALTISFGLLISSSLSPSTTLGIGESWQAAIAQHVLGWVALAGTGVIVFHLTAAFQWLRRERIADSARIAPWVLRGTPSPLGPDVVEIPVDDAHLISAAPLARTILVSRFSVATLNNNSLTAAIDHERAHIAGHHDRLVMLTRLAMATAAGVQASKRFATIVNVAIEFIADDAAAALHGRAAVAQTVRAVCSPDDPLTSLRITRLNG